MGRVASGISSANGESGSSPSAASVCAMTTGAGTPKLCIIASRLASGPAETGLAPQEEGFIGGFQQAGMS
jgi:hypothetical protein